MMRHRPIFTCLIVGHGLISLIQAQNLVPNPSFEMNTACPAGIGGVLMNCTPWINPTSGTSDYFHACNGGAVSVPNNFVGSQPANTGEAYCGGYYYFGGSGSSYREYLQVELTEPLISGVTYDVSLWYSLADNGNVSCGIDKLGIHLSADAPSSGGTSVLDVTPQVELMAGFITNTTTWLQLTSCFVAAGSEKFLTIGNFYTDAQTNTHPDCAGGQLTYMYIDDVSVVLNGSTPGSITVDLGPDVEMCDEAALDPNLSNVGFTWQDGSHNPTFTATETGTYYLTITSGCDIGIDSIDVTIIPSAPPVELGPAQIFICPGQVIEYDLDPALGDYTWQDNSTDAMYVISSPGIYAVTLDDGCHLTNDMIVVVALEAPLPVSLGNDTILCTNEVLNLSFSPTLGDFMWQDMSTGNQFQITMPGSYALTISNQCGEVSDDIEVEYLDDPVLTFQEPIIIACPGDIVELSFDPDLGDFVWQDGSTGPDYEVTQEGDYSVIVTNICASDFADVYVDYLDEPQLDLGDDLFLCPSQLPYLIDVTNLTDAHNVDWQDGSNELVYEIQQSGLYSVTVSNVCFSVEDEILVNVEDDVPQVDLPGDITLCPGETLILDVGSTPGDYTWQDGSDNPIFQVSESGTYAVTVSNLCGVGNDMIVVEYSSSLPQLDLGADINICPGEEVTLQAGIPDGFYLWHTGSTSSTFTVTSSDTVILTVWNFCESISDTVIAVVSASPPALNLQDTISLCQGSTLEIDALIGGVVYDWNTGDETQSILVSTPGTYILTISNTCGMTSDSVIVTDAGTAPVVELGDDLELCPGESISIPANATSGNILWQDGSTGNAFVATGMSVVSVQVMNGCGIVYDTVSVNALPPTPVINLGNDTTLCPGESFVLNPGIPGVDYQWHDGSMNAVYSVNAAGSVSLEISDACGSSYDTVDVTYFPDAPAFNLGADISICPGVTFTLTPDIDDVTYTWHDGSTDPEYLVTQAGVIYVTLESECWEISDTIEIFEDTQGPVVNLGRDTTVCIGESVLIQAHVFGVDYLWQDGTTSDSFLASSSQQIILHVSNACGSDSDTILVTVNGEGPEVELGQDIDLCDGEVFVLTPVITGMTTMLQWQDGASGATYTINAPGEYLLIASNMCGISSDTMSVTALFAPADFNLGSDTVICPGESVTLNAPGTAEMIAWSDGTTTETFEANGGSVWLSVFNQCGTVYDTVMISVNQDAPDVNLNPVYEICEGESVILDVTQEFPVQYLWSTGATVSSITADEEGIYVATITAACDIIEVATEIMFEDCSPPIPPVHIFVPNAFSPNGDNINDYLLIQSNLPERIAEFQLTIFDRWGNVIYYTEELTNAWNGEFKGKAMNPGVYVYAMRWRVVDVFIPELIEYGDITLIR